METNWFWRIQTVCNVLHLHQFSISLLYRASHLRTFPTNPGIIASLMRLMEYIREWYSALDCKRHIQVSCIPSFGSAQNHTWIFIQLLVPSLLNVWHYGPYHHWHFIAYERSPAVRLHCLMGLYILCSDKIQSCRPQAKVESFHLSG